MYFQEEQKPLKHRSISEKALTPEDADRLYKRLQRWVMHLLSRKNYSRKELNEKLSKRYSQKMVADVMIWAEVNRWLLDENEIAARTVELLHQRNKGKMYISNYLKKRGLPAVELDADHELVKAQGLLSAKFADFQEQFQMQESYQDKQRLKAKVMRYLISRGFDMGTAQKAIQQGLNSNN